MHPAAQAISQGRQARNDGDFVAARAYYAEAAKSYLAQEDVLAYVHTIRHIADIYQQESNLVDAKPLYEEALEHYRNDLGTKILDLANTLRPYALLNEEQGDREAAKRLWIEARQLYASLRIEPGVSECNSHISKLQQT